MRVERFSDVARFYSLIEPMLLRREAENNFQLGHIGSLRNEAPDPNHVFLAVFDGDEVVLSAMMTPPWPMCVTNAGPEALDTLANYVRENRITVNEVAGPTVTANHFAATLASASNRRVEVKDQMRIFQLTRVIPPRPVSGSMRVATDADLDLVLRWMQAFHVEIGEIHEIPRERFVQGVTQQRFHLWLDPAPVAIAAWAGRTPNGVRINAVYTPPELRGRGYASNLVAALTQKMLEGGCKFTFLYTDATNPTSNKIYQQLGYEFVCDWVNLKLV